MRSQKRAKKNAQKLENFKLSLGKSVRVCVGVCIHK